MGKKSSVVIGYWYSFGIHMGLCRGPIDEIVEIKAGGKTAWAGSVSSNQINGVSGGLAIDQPDLFGGDEKEGGIQGPLDVMLGARDQPVNARLAAMLGGIVPAFRGVVTAFFDGRICAMSPYPKPWSWRVRRSLKGWDEDKVWYPEKARIVLKDESGKPIHAMNPAHIIYEALTNRDWGRGYERARLDDAVWRAAADTLYAEGFGLCLKWSRSDSLDAFVGGVINHIGAAWGVNRLTGLIVLHLIRDDYDVATLPSFGPDSGLLGIDDDSASGASAATNEVIVKYTRPGDNSEGQVRCQNLASIQQIGRATQINEYPGIPTGELAMRVARRDLRSAAGFVKRYKIRLDRRGYKIAPGSVFKVSLPSRGISSMILRAGRVEDGTLTNGEIAITAVQDVFGLPDNSYGSGATSGFERPNRAPAAVAVRKMLEMSYRDLAHRLNTSDLAAVASSSGYLQVLALRPTSLSLDYAISISEAGGPYQDGGSGHFCPTALVTAALTPATTALTVTNANALDKVATGTAALIEEEVVRIDSIDTSAGQITIARGCADTVATAHPAGARIWFYEDSLSAVVREFTTGTRVTARLLPRTTTGRLDPALAGTDDLIFAQRQARPYPPGQLRINGSAYPATINGVLAVSWATRNRVTQSDQLVDSTAGNITAESGTTWRLRIYAGSTLKRTYEGLTTTSQTYLATDELADGGPFTSLRIVLDAVRDGLYSRQAHDWTVTREKEDAVTT